MGEHDVPRETENEVIRWAQFDFDQKHTSKKQVIAVCSVAACCSVLQCVAVCCSVLQCDAAG